MKFNQLFASSLALSASAVSAQRQRLRGVASSVLLQSDHTNSNIGSSVIPSPSNSDSADSSYSADGEWGWPWRSDGYGDSNSDSGSSDEPGLYWGNNSSDGDSDGDDPDDYDEDLFATNNFYVEENQHDYSSTYIAAGNSGKGYCTGRGINTCDNRKPACRWTGTRKSGRCVDNNNPTPPPTPTFNDGLSQGKQTALKLWRDMGNDCANAWNDFRNSINREISARGWNSNGNWRTNSFNQGARDGMQQVLKEKEEQCFHDSPDECIDLGNEAARIIAFQYCHPNLMSTSNHKDYRATCRAVAISQCSGQVYNNVRSECGAPNTKKLSSLQKKCSNQVKSMIGDSTEEMFFFEN